MLRLLPVLAIALALASGCGARRGGSRPPLPATPFDHVPYREGRPDPSAKVFLVAGGDDIANFAAEVVEQRELWLAAGLEPREIACYWARPTRTAYREDRRQYDELTGELDDCFRAEPDTVLSHLRAAADADLPWVYLYVSGHGLGPVLRWRAGTRDPDVASRKLGATPTEMAALDHHAIGLEAGPGPGLEDVDAVVRGFRSGRPPRALMFSPPTLSEALATFPETTPKFVVLQACFSGGFIGRPATHGGPSPLHDVPALTLLTATRWNRPSFGCSAGPARTQFGGTFGRVLAAELEPGKRPPDLDWARIHERVAFVIDVMETIDAERPSGPSFLRTSPPPEAPDQPVALGPE
jgi:hypothetical protein